MLRSIFSHVHSTVSSTPISWQLCKCSISNGVTLLSSHISDASQFAFLFPDLVVQFIPWRELGFKNVWNAHINWVIIYIGINIGDSLITPSSEPPRNLGVLFDSTCSLNDHVSKICKSINYDLYSIGKIRKYLDTPIAGKMVNCSITSRLDYCNSLLYGAKGYNISQLQVCQNNAARMLSLRR